MINLALQTRPCFECSSPGCKLAILVLEEAGYRRCVICQEYVSPETVVWYDPVTRALSTDKGASYCVGCCPEE